MQITIKSMRIIREGDGSDGKHAYKWVSVMADDGSEKGTEYTTFDAGVLKLGPGSVIDIGDPGTKDGKLKFKKVEKVISEVAAVVTPPPPGPTRETSPEEWKEKQLIERASFEAQTAYKGAIELLAARGMAEEGKELIEAALVWGIKRLNPTLQEALTTMPHLARPEDQKERKTVKPGEPHFENPGQLFEKTNKYGVMRGDILKRYSISEKEVSKINPDEMWDQLVTDGVIVIKEE